MPTAHAQSTISGVPNCSREHGHVAGLRAHLHKAAGLLLQAYEYALELRQDPWHFAVELNVLHNANVSNSDLRWLTSMGYLEHGSETTRMEDSNRSFHYPRPPIYGDKSCFVLTETGADAVGAAFDAHLKASAKESSAPHRGAPHLDEPQALPTWDQDRRQLRWGDRIVKEFKLPAPNQETILTVFQEEGWPPRIDDPLAPASEVHPQRRLHDTIKALNRKQKYDALFFMGDGSGNGVRWEVRAASPV
jgi:hypothetical protein